MSHNLKIETGRRNGTPVHLRLCSCQENEVQSERHVLLNCPLSNDLRVKSNRLNFSNLKELMETVDFVDDLCSYVNEVLKIYV